jgi:hypothetical protein
VGSNRVSIPGQVFLIFINYEKIRKDVSSGTSGDGYNQPTHMWALPGFPFQDRVSLFLLIMRREEKMLALALQEMGTINPRTCGLKQGFHSRAGFPYFLLVVKREEQMLALALQEIGTTTHSHVGSNIPGQVCR